MARCAKYDYAFLFSTVAEVADSFDMQGCLNERRDHLVFLLWGAAAQQKAALIDPERHLVLTAAHPSPRSADRGFFGCRHFSRANAYLRAHGIPEIEW